MFNVLNRCVIFCRSEAIYKKLPADRKNIPPIVPNGGEHKYHNHKACTFNKKEYVLMLK